MIQLVQFIFQKSLFPEDGKNKLKNSKSRQDAYELVSEICQYKNEEGTSPGLIRLFEAGFKQIYKKMSQKKAQESFSYYYYSYNEARSELGYAGLRNLGCICYMNSMIQQLYMTVPFRHLILMADDNEPECLVKKGTKEIDDNIFHQFKAMFANLLLTEKQ
jgi:ubiquitin carboxyl-terminal hydrolase 34